jgi:hypothetical protein
LFYEYFSMRLSKKPYKRYPRSCKKGRGFFCVVPSGLYLEGANDKQIKRTI